MRIGISGASGFVGQALQRELQAVGHQILPLKLRRGMDMSSALADLDALIHLSGASLAQGRWTAQRKAELRSSRVDLSRELCQTLLELRSRGQGPHTLLSASAIGYYPSTEEIHREDSAPGNGFLAELCRDWEGALQELEPHLRLCTLRLGIVLDPQGGALKSMLPPFKLGLGGPIAHGTQGFSWISLGDLCRLFEFLLHHKNAHGPYNAVAGQLSQGEFAQILGQALHRPAFLPLPRALVKLIFGEMGLAMLCEGPRVQSHRLPALGFQFQDPELLPLLQRLFHVPQRN